MITNKKTMEAASSGIELEFEDDKLARAYTYEDGQRSIRELRDDEGFQYAEYPEHKLFRLVENSKGPHQLGGEIPSNLMLPPIKTVVSFQYLGYISNEDEIFKWLPFTLHLICPIYLNFSQLFIDYSDPMNPEVINKEEMEGADTSHDEDLNSDTEIVYKETKFGFTETIEFSPSCAGIPYFLQYPDIPTCPKSGNMMKFVCQLDHGVPVKRSNIDMENATYPNSYEELNFWGDGCLLVFLEPASKVACYIIQNT
jgi:hypothetical protein